MTVHARVLLVVVSCIVAALVFVLLRKHPSPVARLLARLSATCVVAVLLVFGVIRPFIIEEFIIPSGSMIPTLQEGDQVFVNKFIYKFREPRRGEVIVFKAPEKLTDEKGQTFIKRVIGLPGDVLSIRDGQLERNGTDVKERYLEEEMDGVLLPTVVPQDTLYVMGDNRNESSDSRDWGPLDRKLVVGRATVLFFPLSRLRYVR